MAGLSQNFEIPQWVNGVSRIGLVIVGGIYVIGLLIINIDLGRYGLISLNLARPEYIMAGALWTFLSVGSLGALMLAKDFLCLAWAAIRKKAIFSATWNVLLVFGAVCLFDLGLRAVSIGRVGLTSSNRLDTILTYSGIVFNSAILYVGFKVIWSFPKETEPLSPRSLFYATYHGFTPFLALVNLLGALSFYSWAVYPQLGKAFGGGNKPTVRLVVSDSSNFSPAAFALPIEKQSGSIGPVKLVFESESMFFVTPIDPDEKDWRTLGLGVGDTTGIAKELIQALTYVRNK